MNEQLKEAKTKPILSIRGLKVYFPIRKGIIFQRQVGSVKAVDGLDFFINKGETFGLVGESGCGKTTTGRAILRLVDATEGIIQYDGRDITKLSRKELRPLRKEVQMIFQDPYSSLNPRQPIRDIISDAMIDHGIIRKQEKQEKVQYLMELVGLDPRFMNRFPHEFSGGQRQRIGIARSLALNPRFIVCDEPVSALDVSVQAQIINLLQDLQEKLGLTYLFIAHDLSVVRHISDRIAVMYLGGIVELAQKKELFKNPIHSYTQGLLSAVPIPDPVKGRNRKRIIYQGEIPSPINKPPGCAFSTRCPIVIEKCKCEEPKLKEVSEGHWVACLRL
jgi:oligopeptide transport system ATP-binding protein